MKVNKKILRSTLVITVAVLALVAGGSSAFFSDTETSEGNVLQAGAIDLKIDNESYYNYLRCDGEVWTNPGGHQFNDPYLESLIGTECSTTWELTDLDGHLFFDFTDLKPGDWGEDTISTHVVNNDAWLCMDVVLTDTPEYGQSEPEAEVDPSDGPSEGELQNYLRFVWWADDGDNVLEEGERVFRENVSLAEIGTVALADSTENVWDEVPGPIPGGDNPEEYTRYIAKAWCFGDLSLARVANPQEDHNPYDDPGVRCNGALQGLNVAQTDGVLADITFTAIQSRHNGAFKCTGCENPAEGWAVDYGAENQGLKNDGVTPVDASRSTPDNLLGPNDENSFYSLGFGGSIEVYFGYPVVGPLIIVHETTNGTYPLEKAKVEVWDGSTWHEVGEVDNTGSGIDSVDFSAYAPEIYRVRLTDTTDPEIHNDNADGFDVDAVGTTVCEDVRVEE